MSSRPSRRVRPAPEGISDLPAGRAVRVSLPGGRHAELWVPNGLASARAVQRLAGEATRDQERRARALRQLGATATTDHGRLARAQHRSLQRGLEAILEGDTALSQRFSRLQSDWEK